jgi:hypothetical protein
MIKSVLLAAAAVGTAAATVAAASPPSAASQHERTHAAARVAGRSCRAGGYEPMLKPADFGRRITNRYYPLPVGRVLTYRGIKDGQTQVDVVRVTRKTRVIEGITAVVVSDIARHGRRLLEKTTDYFAQDKRGNVWYLGENTAAFSHGRVDHSGSWLAGRHDAEPGIVMLAHPAVPDAYRQECRPGVAEDMAWIVVKGGSFRLRLGTVHGVLTSLEFARIEPGVIDQKVYAPGLGIVSEVARSGEKETAKLVSVRG